MSDKNFDPAMKDTCKLKEAWADGKKLYYVEDIPGLLEQITCLNKQLAKANERVSDLESKLEAVTQEARIQACELDTQKGIVQSVQDKFNLRVYDFNISKALDITLNKFAIEKKIEAINEALDYYEELKASEEPIGAGTILHVCLGRLVSQKEQLRKEQE